MHRDARTMRHINWGATTLALAATITALSTTTAAASLGFPVLIDAATGAEVGSAVVGHAYTYYAGINFQPMLASTADFYDNGQCIGSAPISGPGALQITWVPAATGSHTLTIVGGVKEISEKYDVTAAPAGSTPAQPPKQPGCGGGGSANLIGSGSAALDGSGSAGL
ncbi:hypothetical protein ACIRRA_05250 [Nocardia sp. NPDC101769]|uniref:hypothetical protein n=1 Tax=Nocardia sp. NPDC101769 TaxID=3364333 RepID=UPI0038294278